MTEDSSTPSVLLTSEERERFALWLEADAHGDDALADQMRKLPSMPGELVAMREHDAMAKRRVARLLRSTESVDV